jgi:hypothetical protein
MVILPYFWCFEIQFFAAKLGVTWFLNEGRACIWFLSQKEVCLGYFTRSDDKLKFQVIQKMDSIKNGRTLELWINKKCFKNDDFMEFSLKYPPDNKKSNFFTTCDFILSLTSSIQLNEKVKKKAISTPRESLILQDFWQVWNYGHWTELLSVSWNF